MKAALITEEQIKAIEDALNDSEPFNFDLYRNALAIVKSLKVQEPVAWVKEGNKRVGFGRIEERKYVQFDQTLPVGTKLYTAPPSKPDLSQEMVEALQQWANGERFGDQEELDNARLSRNVILAKIKEQE